MKEEQVIQQIKIIEESVKQACVSKETAIKTLQQAGIFVSPNNSNTVK